MKRVVQRMVVCALSVAMLFTGVPFMAMGNEGEQGGLFGVQEVSAASNTVNPGPSAGEIQYYIRSKGIPLMREHTFDVEPTKPNTPGDLSTDSKQNALKMLNAIRYVAGLDPVTLDDSLGNMQQQAAFVLWSIGRLTHNPIGDGNSKPAGMSDSVWQKGDEGARQANLAWGVENLNQAVLGWLSDGDASNVDMVGHRRLALNPAMGKTGFGAAGSYYSMNSTDKSNGSATATNVIWPAQNTPVQFFNTGARWGEYDPWSLSTGAIETKENIDITLTCTAGSKQGTTWTFDGATTYAASEDGKYMNVDNEQCGLSGCIIFRPDGVTEYEIGDTYDVQITGTSKGTISYTVKFINGYPVISVTIPRTLTLELGQSNTLNAKILPEGAEYNAELKWTSSDPSVAKVDSNGRVTPVSHGKTIITCMVQGISEICVVDVITRLSLLDDDIETTVGNVTYTGKAETPEISVRNKKTGEVYARGVDYIVEYYNDATGQWSDTPSRIEPGNGKIRFSTNGCSGKLKENGPLINYSVTAKPITVDMITDSYYHSNPTVTVEHGDLTLKEGQDYTLTVIEDGEEGTADITVTAVLSNNRYTGAATKTVPLFFAKKGYHIFFDANGGGGIMDEMNMVFGKSKPLLANTLTRPGHTFTGWNTEADGSGTAYKDKQSVNNLTTINNDDVFLYAQWKLHTYTVKFNANGGTGTMSDLRMAYEEEKALPANAFTKKGYTFSGWKTWPKVFGTAYTDGQVVQNLTNIDNGIVLLHAQWTPNTYTVKFDANTGKGIMNDLAMTHNAAMPLPANGFTKDGHTFMGWNTEPNGSGTAYTDEQVVKNLTNSGTITLYAQWDSDSYNIVFDANEGTGTMGDLSMARDEEKALPANAFTKRGCTFSGWNTKANGSGTGYTDKEVVKNLANDGTVKLYAQWTDGTYSSTYMVKFNANGGMGTTRQMFMIYDMAKPLTANAFTRTGYTFTGWNTEADGSGIAYTDKQSVKNLTSINNSTVTLYAQWTGNTYTITYQDVEDDDGYLIQRSGEDIVDTVTLGDNWTVRGENTYTKDSAHLEYWEWTAESGEKGKWYPGTTGTSWSIMANVTVWPHYRWTHYYIKLDPNGGSSDTPMDIVTKRTWNFDALPRNTYEKEGYTFSGWNTKADGSGTTFADEERVGNLTWNDKETITLYAQWCKEDSYIITFSANKGTGSMTNLYMNRDEEKPLSPNTYTRDGYTFSGWNTKADGTGTVYTDKQVVRNESITPLYAQWTPNTYTIRFDANTGTGEAMPDILAIYGDWRYPYFPRSTYTKEGYDFAGWNTKVDGSGTAFVDTDHYKNLTTTNNGVVTLYAQWKTKGTYFVGFNANKGTGTMPNLLMIRGEEKALPANTYTRTGYTFAGWNNWKSYRGEIPIVRYKDQQIVKNLPDINNIEGTLYAQWVPITYKVKFDANGGSGTMAYQSMVYDNVVSLTKCSIAKPGAIFDGWNTKADGTGMAYADKASVKNLTTVNKGAVTLYAQWMPSDITIKGIPAQTYTGRAIEPSLTVESKGKLLTDGVDYDVVYSDNIRIGTAKARVIFKGEYTGSMTVQFTIKSAGFVAKSLWVSKHENTYVTFNWTGTPDNKQATGWDVQYRTKLIGTQNPWSNWSSTLESGKTLSKRVYLKPNHTIEFKIKHEKDNYFLRSVFTTPAGGVYQSVTRCRVKVVAVDSGALYRQETKTLSLPPGVNFAGDTGNIIYIKKGKSIKITPNHVYPRSNYSKYPRLYPNHAWYDVADSSVISLTGTNSTAGMKDSAVTIKGLKVGTTTVKITSCNGRGATLTIVVK